MTHAETTQQPYFKPSLSERSSHPRLERLFACAASAPPPLCAVVHVTDPNALASAVHAAEEGILRPVLIGPEKQIRTMADERQLDLTDIEIRPSDYTQRSLTMALDLARGKQVQALMQGTADNTPLLNAVLASNSGLHTENRISHIYVFDVPSYHKPLFISDAVVNATPDLEVKTDIIRNAVDLFRTMGMGEPKIAILAAHTHVTRKLPATIDAASLCKQVERGQIEGAILDGPLTFDIAINADVAHAHGIFGHVVGDADVLLVPNIEAGKILERQLRYFAKAEGAGLLLGTSLPVILTDRNDTPLVRLMSAALASVVHTAQLENRELHAI